MQERERKRLFARLTRCMTPEDAAPIVRELRDHFRRLGQEYTGFYDAIGRVWSIDHAGSVSVGFADAFTRSAMGDDPNREDPTILKAMQLIETKYKAGS